MANRLRTGFLDGRAALTRPSELNTAAVMADGPPGFAVERSWLRGVSGVLIRGEVDIETAPRVTAALDAAIRETHGALVVDLSDVEFLDSSGLNVLLRARALLGREERALVIVCPPGPARRIFDVAGVADLLHLFGSRELAAAALRPARRPAAPRGRAAAPARA
jgi:anti-sigma B factor antagonist